MSIYTYFLILICLILGSAFFSMTETAMTAVNRHRLRHAASEGNRGAKMALQLLAKLEKMLSVILLGNTILNSFATMVAGQIAVLFFGGSDWALEFSALLVAFCLLIFSEITPKVLAATYPEWLVPRLSYVLTPVMRVASPATWIVNLLVGFLLKAFGFQSRSEKERGALSLSELRMVVLEGGPTVSSQYRSILLNLFDLGDMDIDEVMTPRQNMVVIDMTDSLNDIKNQIASRKQTFFAVCEKDHHNIIGILDQRRLMPYAMNSELTHDVFRKEMQAPYYIPSSTGVYEQLDFFKDTHHGAGFVVDEYGEILGFITLEGMVEAILGSFSKKTPGVKATPSWHTDGTATVDGGISIRLLNRSLGLSLPVDEASTLNGLLLEVLQTIPESAVSLRIDHVTLDILQVEDRRIKTVKIHRPGSKETG